MYASLDIHQKLNQAYDYIARERMADIPILNHRVSVEAVGFKTVEAGWLGIMITPWFMNLMILPIEEEPAQEDASDQADDNGIPLLVGSKHHFDFPAGSFEFIYGEEEAIGPHYTCSLFSPMFDFEDHAAALETAQHILAMIHEPKEEDALDIERANHRRMEEIWRAPEPETNEDLAEALDTDASDDESPQTIEETKAPSPLSRRSFLGMPSQDHAASPADISHDREAV